MVTLTQAEYDKFKNIMCAYFDVDGGELPKSFEKDLLEQDIIQIKDSEDCKVTDKQLDELCRVLEKVLDNQEVRDAWDVVSEFRSNLEYYDMIAQKQCTAEEYKLAKDGEYSTQKH